MHIHLVPFQLIQTFSLKLIPEGCAIYELDFFRFSKYTPFQNLSNSDLCKYLKNITLSETDKLYEFMGNYSLETDF